MRNEEKSMHDWDYAIITNRYIPPAELKEGKWPPADALHVVYADSVPICAVLKRKSKDDYLGYQALINGDTGMATGFFLSALKEDSKDEMIFFNFAAVLAKEGMFERADSLLREGLKLNPDSEPVLMYLGNIAASGNRKEEAMSYYKRLIGINRKYLDAYVSLAGLMGQDERKKARGILRECLGIDPNYKPAIVALANTYRNSDPEIARKYDELANKIK
jgi:tetratricopeptide (TPR) repeat protein